MKNFIIISIFFSSIALSSEGQKLSYWNRPVLQQDYLKLSRDQKTTGLVCLGITGVIVAIAAPGHIDFDVLPVVAGIGLTSALSSIPLFIASGRNKRKARLMATSQKTAFGALNNEKYINGITLRLPLGKKINAL